MAVASGQLHNLFLGFQSGNPAAIVSKQGKDGVPYAGAEGGEANEPCQSHACQSGGDADELPYGRHQTSDECGDGSVAVEELFGIFHLFRINQQQMSPTAVGKGIYDGAAKP